MVGRWRDADCASPSLQVTPITDRLGNRKTQGAEAREKENEKEKEKEREMERERERESAARVRECASVRERERGKKRGGSTLYPC